MAWKTYKEKLRLLSQGIVTAQQPIRILESIKWPQSIVKTLIESNFKELPKLDKDDYSLQQLGFDPKTKIDEFNQIIIEIKKLLGEEDDLAQHMLKSCEEYKLVIEMLMNRGQKRFYEISKTLYGSPKDLFLDGKTTIRDISLLMYQILSGIDDNAMGILYEQNIPGTEVVESLNFRFKSYFTEDPVRALLSDGILADAAAGSDYIKIRTNALFSQKDIQLLEVHEGWVHVGTTMNGSKQHLCPHLSKGPPRTTATQEGLAILLELFTFSSFPRRARSINDRLLAIDKAEDGANALELIEFFRTEGYSEGECIKNTQRALRGGCIQGGSPFTKDISYIKGFVENYNFIRASMKAGRVELLPFMFTGKLNILDVPMIHRKYEEGFIDPPHYLPPQFKDLNGISVWMSFSNAFNKIHLESAQSFFDKILS